MMKEIVDLLDMHDADTGGAEPGYITDWLKAYYHVFDQYSAYAEVRASVPNTDDPTLPVETFRTYFLGLVSVALFAFLNQVPTHGCCVGC
jgi:hypothetical protein